MTSRTLRSQTLADYQINLRNFAALPEDYPVLNFLTLQRRIRKQIRRRRNLISFVEDLHQEKNLFLDSTIYNI